MASITRADEDEEPDPSLPDSAEHIIAFSGAFGGPEPEGFPEDDTILYETGDELPFEKTKELVAQNPKTLAALDADGNVVAGGEESPSPGLARSSEGLDEALKRWRSGEGFDPSEYDPESADD